MEAYLEYEIITKKSENYWNHRFKPFKFINLLKEHIKNAWLLQEYPPTS